MGARQGTTVLPYVELSEDEGYAKPGGNVKRWKAAAALNVGDVVFASATDTVNKSATPANYQAMVGVVVGGKATFGEIITDWVVGSRIPAAAANEEVIVQFNGITYVVSDGAVTQFAYIGPPATTAGRVDDGGNATAGQILGIALDAATGANEKIRALIKMR